MRTLPRRFLAFFIGTLLLVPACTQAQMKPSAYVRKHHIYVGGEYALYNSDYFGGNKSLDVSAFSIYGNYTVFSGKWPLALELNYTKVPNHYGTQQRYLSSFLAGPTVHRRLGRLEPFAKVGAGIGHFSYVGADPHNIGEHFAIGIGGGLDYRLTHHIMLRPVDFTFERWNFYPNALSPEVLGFGLSYRIH